MSSQATDPREPFVFASVGRPAEAYFPAWSGAGLIAGLALLVYYPALRGDFLLDDDFYLTNSSLIRSSDGLFQFWFTTKAADYLPITNSSFWLQWRLWGMHSAGYHCTNLLLHIASAILIWAVLKKLAIPGAYLAALLDRKSTRLNSS